MKKDKPRITYFYRNSQCGFSIQRVFQTLTTEIEKHAEIEEVYMPAKGSMPWDIMRNCIYAYRHRNKQGINHITGDIHYLCRVLNKKKLVVTVHDIMYYSYLSGLKKKIWKLFYIDSLKKATKVVFISCFAKEQVTNIMKLPKEKIIVIPNAVSTDYKYRHKIFNKENPVILHIGTLERKNLYRTILALKGVRCHLRIAGRLNAAILELLNENNIEYYNVFNLTNEQMAEEYGNCDIVNFPSLYEGFGMPIIEGQTAGRIVVTSNISPMKDVAADGAALVNPFDIKSIRNGYLTILHDEQFRNEIIEKGLENIKRFSVENIAKQYLNLYDQILSK
jgi:glycosyltransferase involved in cell wall biosynthesis